MKIIHFVNPDNLSEDEVLDFPRRLTARAIVLNENRDKIAMQYAVNHRYYKLPGGGIEEGEDMETALKRECLEELGYDIIIESELGAVVEYRKSEYSQIHQTSYCFIAHVEVNPNL